MELRFDGLGVEIKGTQLLSDLKATAGSGETLGLVGPNGSGKSTALRCVYRALTPSSGAVMVDDEDLQAIPPRTSAQSIAALTQEGAADFDFTVREVVALGRTPHRRANEPLTRREHALCEQAMEQMHIAHLADRGVLGLSGGEHQRVLIARTLVQEPRILILDEPTNHLDIRHQLDVLSMVRESDLTIVVVLHDLNLAAAVCDRLAVLDEGRLVRIGPPQEVLTEELLREVFHVHGTVVEHPLSGHPQVLFSLDGTPGEHPSIRPTARTSS